jgi:hypothetical protein
MRRRQVRQHPPAANPTNWYKQLTRLVSILPHLMWCLKTLDGHSWLHGEGGRFLFLVAIQPGQGAKASCPTVLPKIDHSFVMELMKFHF